MTEPVNTKATPKAGLKAIWILCFALIAGATVFALLALLVNLLKGPSIPAPGNESGLIFPAVVAAIAIICTIRAAMVYRKGIAAIKNSIAPLNNKLEQYRSVMILYMALCEFPALFSIIIFFVDGYYPVFAITALMLLAMLLRMPQKRKIIRELDLNWQEQQELE